MRRADWALLSVWLFSLLLEGVLIWAFFEWDAAYSVERCLLGLIFCLPVPSAFCLQFLLCRRGRKWPALLLTALAVIGLGYCVGGLVMAQGWDGLEWGFRCFLAGALLAGCALAWGVYGIYRLIKWCS